MACQCAPVATCFVRCLRPIGVSMGWCAGMSARHSTFGSSPRRAGILRVQKTACSTFRRSAMLPRWLRPKTVSGHPDCGSRALFPFLERAVSAALSYPISCRWVSHRPVTEAPQLREDGGPTGNRTRVRGFAVLYVTTPPSGPDCVKAAQMLRFSAAVNRDLPPCRNNPVAALRRCRSERENTVT
jgi:hypothetical protein